jgi:hypothetical protein
LAIGS